MKLLTKFRLDKKTISRIGLDQSISVIRLGKHVHHDMIPGIVFVNEATRTMMGGHLMRRLLLLAGCFSTYLMAENNTWTCHLIPQGSLSFCSMVHICTCRLRNIIRRSKEETKIVRVGFSPRPLYFIDPTMVLSMYLGELQCCSRYGRHPGKGSWCDGASFLSKCGYGTRSIF